MEDLIQRLVDFMDEYAASGQMADRGFPPDLGHALADAVRRDPLMMARIYERLAPVVEKHADKPHVQNVRITLPGIAVPITFRYGKPTN